MYNRDEIGKRIKSARQEKNLSQMQFAELINVSTPYLSDIENGKPIFPLKYSPGSWKRYRYRLTGLLWRTLRRLWNIPLRN